MKRLVLPAFIGGWAFLAEGLRPGPRGHRPAPTTPVGAGSLVVVVAAVAAFAGCGGEDAPSGCGPDVRERIDPGSAVHLLPGAPEPEYLSDPPTSGPHVAGPLPAGAQAAPLDRPTQVQVLEAGRVLLQHEGLADDQRAALEALASQDVVVAPGRDLPAPVVATAWGSKRLCEVVAEEPLTDFVDDHQGHGPGTG